MLKGVSGRYGKKPTVIDENRRNTYKQSQWSTFAYDLPLLTDGEKKQLIPVSIDGNSLTFTFGIIAD